MTGVRSRPSRVVHDRSQVSSANVMPAACTATSASPGPGAGAGARSNTSCSGPPRACARSAIIAGAVVEMVTGLQPLLGEPGQALVGDGPPAAVDGEAVAAVGELHQVG